MANSNLLVIEKQRLIITGESNRSWQDAYNQCFVDMRRQFSKEENKVYVHVSLIEVYSEKRIENEKKQLLSLGAKTQTKQVQLDVSVEIKYLEIKEEN